MRGGGRKGERRVKQVTKRGSGGFEVSETYRLKKVNEKGHENRWM